MKQPCFRYTRAVVRTAAEGSSWLCVPGLCAATGPRGHTNSLKCRGTGEGWATVLKIQFPSHAGQTGECDPCLVHYGDKTEAQPPVSARASTGSSHEMCLSIKLPWALGRPHSFVGSWCQSSFSEQCWRVMVLHCKYKKPVPLFQCLVPVLLMHPKMRQHSYIIWHFRSKYDFPKQEAILNYSLPLPCSFPSATHAEHTLQRGCFPPDSLLLKELTF